MVFYLGISCPKCGSSCVDVNYIQEKRIYSYCGLGKLKHIIPEHLECKCGACKCGWKNKTKEQIEHEKGDSPMNHLHILEIRLKGRDEA